MESKLFYVEKAECGAILSKIISGLLVVRQLESVIRKQSDRPALFTVIQTHRIWNCLWGMKEKHRRKMKREQVKKL